MKRLAPFILIIVAFFLYKHFTREAPVEPTAAEEEVAEAEPIATPIPLQKTAPAIARQAPALVPKEEVSELQAKPAPEAKADPAEIARRPVPRPPQGSVSYHREGRLLVAFGDVILGEPTDKKAPDTGYAKINPVNGWESATIPYHITPQVKHADRIQKVIAYFNENTPIKFVPFNGQKDAIVFETQDKHCRSYLGRIGGHQPIYLADDCGERAIAHEILHALGFVHEHSRPERDNYVNIIWQNIEESKKDQFEIAPEELLKLVEGRPFDMRSVMLYQSNAFAKTENLNTLESKVGDAIDPVAEGLSREDIDRLFSVYGGR